MKMFLSCAIVLVCASVGFSQCQTIHRRPVFTYSTTYQYPVVKEVVDVVPVAVPVLVPAFQFQYVAPCVTPPAAVPVHQPVAQTHTAPQTQSQSSGISQDQIRALARALIAEMTKDGGGGQGSEDDGPPMVPGLPESRPQRPQHHLGVLQQKCGSCHSGAAAKSGVMIFGEDGKFNPAVDRQRLLDAVEQGRMPPADRPEFKLSQAELSVVRSGLSN